LATVPGKGESPENLCGKKKPVAPCWVEVRGGASNRKKKKKLGGGAGKEKKKSDFR